MQKHFSALRIWFDEVFLMTAGTAAPPLLL